VTRQVVFGSRTEIGRSLKMKIQAIISNSCDWQRMNFFQIVYLFFVILITGYFFASSFYGFLEFSESL